jgi:hypothetical protein
MKAATLRNSHTIQLTSPLARKRGNPFFRQRDWDSIYEGLPNATVEAVEIHGSCAHVKIRLEGDKTEDRIVGALEYLVGRRGSLNYLDTQLRSEVMPDSKVEFEPSKEGVMVSSRTLRVKAEVNMEVAPSVFITGSLTGDSLVRHTFGSCVYAASKILGVNSV